MRRAAPVDRIVRTGGSMPGSGSVEIPAGSQVRTRRLDLPHRRCPSFGQVGSSSSAGASASATVAQRHFGGAMYRRQCRTVARATVVGPAAGDDDAVHGRSPGGPRGSRRQPAGRGGDPGGDLPAWSRPWTTTVPAATRNCEGCSFADAGHITNTGCSSTTISRTAAATWVSKARPG